LVLVVHDDAGRDECVRLIRDGQIHDPARPLVEPFACTRENLRPRLREGPLELAFQPRLGRAKTRELRTIKRVLRRQPK
jgi:hypothetical protein